MSSPSKPPPSAAQLTKSTTTSLLSRLDYYIISGPPKYAIHEKPSFSMPRPSSLNLNAVHLELTPSDSSTNDIWHPSRCITSHALSNPTFLVMALSISRSNKSLADWVLMFTRHMELVNRSIHTSTFSIFSPSIPAKRRHSYQPILPPNAAYFC
jgi:hypothetical protein